MCTSCESGKGQAVRKSRLLVVLGFLGATMITGIAVVAPSPALAAFLPLVFFATTCPLMCAVPSVVSWVKGGKRVAHVHDAS